jgi:signal transduction histidine kinase
MYKIVDELLLLSRIRKEDVQPVLLNIPDLIREAVKRLNGNTQSPEMILPESWPKVYGHPQWIEEVWFNLITNALKYGGNPPKIHIGYNQIDNSAYRFWIQDNGDGLSQESLDKLFQDFERLGRKNKEGHGLGLSIIKRIIEKLGGEVQVTSENIPGKGCVFSFTLKAVEKFITY